MQKAGLTQKHGRVGWLGLAHVGAPAGVDMPELYERERRRGGCVRALRDVPPRCARLGAVGDAAGHGGVAEHRW